MLIWIAFLGFILVLLALDLGVFHRRARVVTVREALAWTVVWIATALAFAGFVYFGYAHHWLGMGLEPDPVDRSAAYPDGRVNDARSAVLKFLTGYVVELSLSADNVFVIAMLFGYFAIPRMYQHRVLFWGILGALLMRGGMIAIGAQLVARFSWILSVFGVLLILTAGKMAFMSESGDPGRNLLVRLMRRFLPMTDRFHGEHFFVRVPSRGPLESEPGASQSHGDTAVTPDRRARWLLTPLAPALVMVETTDLVFAVDSIPAIFAITADPFLVFTSNVFAILGLRSLYFALAGALHVFHYLKHALALVLLTVGVKMLAHSWLEQVLGPDFNLYLLGTVVVILGAGVLVSAITVRWGDKIGRAASAAARTVVAWVVPDDLMETVAREGRLAAAQNARRSFARVSLIATMWRRLFHHNVRNIPVLVINQIIVECEPYAAYL